MKKKLSIILVLALVLAVVAGCSSNTAGQGSAPEDSDSSATSGAAVTTGNDSKQIAGVVFQEDQFMKLLQLGYKDTAEAAGYEFLPGNTNNDQGKESELINTYCDQKIAGMAITPISEEASVAGLKKALDSNIVVGLSNTIVLGEPRFAGCYTSDNYELGKSTGEVAKQYIEEKMGGKANVAVVQFKSLLAEQSTARSTGFTDQIKDLPGVKFVVDQDAWLQDKAITVVSDILTAHPEVDLVFCANEGGTIGATMAVQNAGKAGKVVVFGTDASKQMFDLLKDNTNILQAVTGQDPYNIGVQTMNAVIAHIQGTDTSEMTDATIVPGMLFVRGDNQKMDDYLADLAAKGVE